MEEGANDHMNFNRATSSRQSIVSYSKRVFLRDESVITQIMASETPSNPTQELVNDALNEIYDGEKARVDIVFVHGLRGHPRTSWEAFNKYGDRVFWPKDLLPTTIPQCRIFSFGYLTNVAAFYPSKKGDVIAHTGMDDNSNSLMVKLGNRRRETNTESRPIIFVAHSLGGLVVANGLSSQAGPNEQRQEVVDNTCGTIFMGTPFGGSEKAIWANLAEKFLGLFVDSNDQTIKDLDKKSKKLASVSEEFHKLLARRYNTQDLNPIQVACFFETVKTTKNVGVKKDLGIIVSKQSASLAGSDPMGINEDHCSMCKFENAHSTGYVDVTDTIKLMMDNWDKKKDDRESNNGRINITLGDVKQGHGVLNYGGIVQGHVVGTTKDAVNQVVSNLFSSGNGTSTPDPLLQAWIAQRNRKDD
jgi:hypothetical protein